MNNNDQIKIIADQLAEYMWEKHFMPKITTMLRFFRAEVVKSASNGKIQIKKPLDDTILSLPYVGSAAALSAGSQCTVLVLGSYSNSIIIGDGTLSNL